MAGTTGADPRRSEQIDAQRNLHRSDERVSGPKIRYTLAQAHRHVGVITPVRAWRPFSQRACPRTCRWTYPVRLP